MTNTPVVPMSDKELAELDIRLKKVQPNEFCGHYILNPQGVLALRERLRLAEEDWSHMSNITLRMQIELTNLQKQLDKEIEYHALTNSLAKGYLADLNNILGELAAEKQELTLQRARLARLKEAVRAYGSCPTSHNEQAMHLLVLEQEGGR